jgi:hypothetical protein
MQPDFLTDNSNFYIQLPYSPISELHRHIQISHVCIVLQRIHIIHYAEHRIISDSALPFINLLLPAQIYIIRQPFDFTIPRCCLLPSSPLALSSNIVLTSPCHVVPKIIGNSNRKLPKRNEQLRLVLTLAARQTGCSPCSNNKHII